MQMSYMNPIEHCPHKTASHRSFYGNPRIRRGSRRVPSPCLGSRTSVDLTQHELQPYARSRPLPVTAPDSPQYRYALTPCDPNTACPPTRTKSHQSSAESFASPKPPSARSWPPATRRLRQKSSAKSSALGAISPQPKRPPGTPPPLGKTCAPPQTRSKTKPPFSRISSFADRKSTRLNSS